MEGFLSKVKVVFPMATHSKWDKIYVIFATLGVLSGASGFFVFLIAFKNVQAAVWAFFAGFYALWTLFLLLIKILDLHDQWYGGPQLIRIWILGGIGALAGFVATVCYFSAMIALHERLPTMSTLSKSHFIMAIWSIMTLKWSLSTALLARRLHKSIRSGYHSI